MKALVVGISGSPSATSKTALLTELALDRIAGPHCAVRHLRVAALSPAALLAADTRAPDIAAALDTIAGAHGLIIATPIYKAAYSGLLKTFLDLLPQFGLAGKVVLPLATGGSLAHVLALDYALRPVLQSMAARHVIQGQFVPEAQMLVQDGQLTLGAEAAEPLRLALDHFLHAVTPDPQVRHLGLPRLPGQSAA